MSWSANIPLLSHVNLEAEGRRVPGTSDARFTAVTGWRPGAGEAAGAAHRGVTTRHKQTSWRNTGDILR